MNTQHFSRSDLDGQRIHMQIQEILSILLLGYAPVYSPPSPGTMKHQVRDEILSRPVTEWLPLTRVDIARYNTALNTLMKLLTKVLPDLKAVELTDTTSQRLLEDMDLAQRITSVVGNASLLTGPTTSPHGEPTRQ